MLADSHCGKWCQNTGKLLVYKINYASNFTCWYNNARAYVNVWFSLFLYISSTLNVTAEN